MLGHQTAQRFLDAAHEMRLRQVIADSVITDSVITQSSLMQSSLSHH
jgi:hypothetical protein